MREEQERKYGIKGKFNKMKKKTTALFLASVCITALASGCAGIKISGSPKKEAVYLGIKDYGAEEINKDNKDEFFYRFEIDGAETDLRLMNGTKDQDGNYDYPLQNRLKEGYSYRVTIVNDMVTSVEEILNGEYTGYEPAVKGIPGKKTLKNFLQTALEPVGTTLYIYGGGWDWQDTGSAVQARTIGVSSDWVRFFETHDANFAYKESDSDGTKTDPATGYYPYGGFNEYYYAGLDCSGYIGWILYNTFESENDKEGYVGSSTGFARRLSEKGLGEWTQDVKAPDKNTGYKFKPGDIMSINGHVWLSLGTCGDGSVVILHSSPSLSRTGQPGGGVQISAIGTKETCEAYRLADMYMSEHYPLWYERYPVYLCDPDRYFMPEGENAGRFTWDTEYTDQGLTDPDHIQDMEPKEVLEKLFPSQE